MRHERRVGAWRLATGVRAGMAQAFPRCMTLQML
jgi:hypothetical protein